MTKVIFGFFDSVLLHSQPFGGCAILYRQNFVSSVRQVETPSRQFCAVMIDCHNCYCLLLSTYYHSAAAAAGNSGRFVGFISTVSHEFLIVAGD